MEKLRALLLTSITLLSTPLLAQQSDAFNIFVPDLIGGLQLSVGTYYAEPVLTATYAGMQVGDVNEVKNIDVNYDWGFLGELAYIFPHSGTELALTYRALDANDSDSAQGDITLPFPSV